MDGEGQIQWIMERRKKCCVVLEILSMHSVSEYCVWHLALCFDFIYISCIKYIQIQPNSLLVQCLKSLWCIRDPDQGLIFTPSWQEELSRQSIIWWRIILSKPVFLLKYATSCLVYREKLSFRFLPLNNNDARKDKISYFEVHIRRWWGGIHLLYQRETNSMFSFSKVTNTNHNIAWLWCSERS